MENNSCSFLVSGSFDAGREVSRLTLQIKLSLFCLALIDVLDKRPKHIQVVAGEVKAAATTKFEIEIFFNRKSKTDLAFKADECSDLLNRVLDDAGYAIECLNLGSQAAELAQAPGRSRPVLRIMSSGCNAGAMLDENGHLHLPNNPRPVVKRLKALLETLADAQKAGLAITVNTDGMDRKLPALHIDALKCEYRPTDEQTSVVELSGYLPIAHVAEIKRNAKYEEIKIPVRDIGEVDEALHANRILELREEVSLPTNPVLPNDPKLAVLAARSLLQDRFALDALLANNRRPGQEARSREEETQS